MCQNLLLVVGEQDQEEASTSAGASNGAGSSGGFQPAEVRAEQPVIHLS